MNVQEKLFVETIYDALTALIDSLGGAKKVGTLLWPSKPMPDAQRLVLKCLDPERAEKFSPEEVLFLMIEGRKVNCHIVASFIGDKCFYDFKVVEPEDRRNELMREYIDATKRLEKTAQAIIKLSPQQG